MRIGSRSMWLPAVTLVATSCLTGAVLSLNDDARAVITTARPGAWMASHDAGSVSHVGPDGVDATVNLTTAVGDLRVVQVDGVAYVTDAEGRLSRIDPAQLEVSQEAMLPSSSARLVAGGGRLYAVDTAGGTVRELDPVQLTSIGQPLALAPKLGDAVVGRDGVLWVADVSTGDVVPVDGRTVGPRQRVADPGVDVRLSVVGADVVVVNPADSTATVVSGPAPTTPRAVPTESGRTIEVPGAVDEGSVLPILTGARTLTLLHVRTGDVRTVDLGVAGHDLGVPRVSAGRAYVPDFTAGAVIVVDLASATVTGTIAVTGRPGSFEVLVDGTSVYVNDPRTEKAWTIRPSGELVPVAKYDPNSPRGGGATRTVVPPAPELPPPPAGGDAPTTASPPTVPPMPTTTTTDGRRNGDGDGDGAATTTVPPTVAPTTVADRPNRTVTPTSVATGGSTGTPGSGGPRAGTTTTTAPGEPGPTTTAPGAPAGDGAVANVVAVSGDGSATVTWTPPTGWHAVTGYTVTVRAAGNAPVRGPSSVRADADATGVTIRPLENGRRYTFEVTAQSRQGDGRAVASNPVVPARDAPPAPSITAVTPGDGQVEIRWAWTGPTTVDGYVVQLVDGASTPVASRPVAGTVTTATFTGLTNGVELRAVVYATVDDPSGPVTGRPATSSPFVTRGRPGAPGAVMAAVSGNGRARVTWTPAPANGSAITGYAVSVTRSGTSTPVAGPTATPDATQAEVGGLAVGAAYTFTVTATNAYGTSAATSTSVVIDWTDPPGAPGAVTATAEYRAVTVAWGAADGNGTTVASYIVRNLCDGTTRAAPASATSLLFDGLAPGSACDFDVRAIGANGAQGPSTATAGPVVVLGTPQPTGLAVATDNADPTSATLTFAQPAPTGPAIMSWQVTTTPDTGPHALAFQANPTLVIGGLTPGTAYTFTVVAVDAVGGTSPAAATTATTPTGRPPAPATFTVNTSVASTSTGQLRVTFTWAPVPGATSYRLVRQEGMAALDLTTTSYQWRVFGDDGTYTATVVAVNAWGESIAATAVYDLPYWDPIDLGCPRKPYGCPLP